MLDFVMVIFQAHPYKRTLSPNCFLCWRALCHTLQSKQKVPLTRDFVDLAVLSKTLFAASLGDLYTIKWLAGSIHLSAILTSLSRLIALMCSHSVHSGFTLPIRTSPVVFGYNKKHRKTHSTIRDCVHAVVWQFPKSANFLAVGTNLLIQGSI